MVSHKTLVIATSVTLAASCLALFYCIFFITNKKTRPYLAGGFFVVIHQTFFIILLLTNVIICIMIFVTVPKEDKNYYQKSEYLKQVLAAISTHQFVYITLFAAVVVTFFSAGTSAQFERARNPVKKRQNKKDVQEINDTNASQKDEGQIDLVLINKLKRQNSWYAIVGLFICLVVIESTLIMEVFSYLNIGVLTEEDVLIFYAALIPVVIAIYFTSFVFAVRQLAKIPKKHPVYKCFWLQTLSLVPSLLVFYASRIIILAKNITNIYELLLIGLGTLLLADVLPIIHCTYCQRVLIEKGWEDKVEEGWI